MKKYLFILAVAICVVTASSDSRGQVVFGAKGGLNLTKGKFTDSNTELALKWNIGVLSEIKVSEKFFLRPELLYSLKGWNSEPIGSNDQVTTTISYVNIPALVGYRFGDKFSAYTGLEAGFKIKATSDNQAWIDLFEKFDLGLVLGAKFALTPKVGIDMRYIHGFKDLISFDMKDKFGNPTGETHKEGSNRVVQIGVYYLLKK